MSWERPRGRALPAGLRRGEACDPVSAPLPQFLNALNLLLAYDLSAIRKFSREDEVVSGSTVKKFEQAFASNGSGGRAKGEQAKAALHVVASFDDDDGNPAA